MDTTKYQKAGKELNEVLGLEPAIDIKADEEDLKEQLEEAAECVYPEDDLSIITWNVLEEISDIEKPDRIGDITGKKEQDTEQDIEQDTESEEVDSESDDNIEGSWKEHFFQAVDSSNPEITNRETSIAHVMASGETKKTEIVRKSAELYAEKMNEEPNYTGAKWAFQRVRRALLAFGLAEQTKEEFFVK